MPRRKREPLHPETPVEELHNLSVLSAGWLRAEGVSTHGDLARRDLFELWLALRAAHPQVTRLMYYAMWGALHDAHWRAVPEKEKQRFERRRAALEGAPPRPKRAAKRAR